MNEIKDSDFKEVQGKFGIRNSEITQKYIPCVLKFFYRPVWDAPRKYCRPAPSPTASRWQIKIISPKSL